MQELILTELFRTATPRRLWNVLKVSGAFAASLAMRKPRMWGLPPVLTVEPTNYCNLECPLCVTGSGRMQRPGGRMSLDMFKRLVDEIGDKIWYVIFFHQGEPYLNNAFLPAVAYAHQHGLYTTTSTNAHYLDTRNAERTVASGLSSMIVSLDGATQATYARYRVGGELERVLQGIRNLVAAKEKARSKTPYILLQFLVMRHNEHEVPAIEKLARELKVDRLLKKNIQVETYEEALEWMPRDEKFQRYAIGEKEIRVRRGGRGTCPRPFLSALVNWDGGVVPCCFDKNGAFPMGDLRDGQSFTEIWSNGAYSDFRTKMLKRREEIDICKNCNQGFGIWI